VIGMRSQSAESGTRKMTMRIQRTREGTFLVVETDSDGKTFAFDEKDTYLEACDVITQWIDWEQAWDNTEDDEEI
jgi:hypothetical protein